MSFNTLAELMLMILSEFPPLGKKVGNLLKARSRGENLVDGLI